MGVCCLKPLGLRSAALGHACGRAGAGQEPQSLRRQGRRRHPSRGRVNSLLGPQGDGAQLRALSTERKRQSLLDCRDSGSQPV